jgi:hypothetical protein
METFNHPGWRHPENHLNIGGPWYSIKDGLRKNASGFGRWYTDGSRSAFPTFYYDGGIIVGIDPTPVSKAAFDGSAFGASAYKKMKPTKPSIQSLNSLFELKDLPGMLKQRFTPSLKGAADFHLATQFGWLPLWSDIKKMVELQKKLQDRLNYLISHNGKPVYRKTEMYEDSSITASTVLTPVQASIFPSFPAKNIAGTNTGRTFSSSSKRVWAEARFRYHLPEGPRDIVWTRYMISRIYGLRLTPSVVYNAIPWSWLVDWFGNVGDVLENMDVGVADRLAADYFYVMSSSTVSTRTEIHAPMVQDPSNASPTVVMPSSERYYSQKRRLPGDPFGFATNQNDLNGMQLSILGALGISKLR